MGAIQGHYQLLMAGSGGGGGGYTAETNLWITRATAAGASPLTATTDKLNDLSVALAAASYSSKIKWLAPFFGATIAEAFIPLRDTLNVGAMSNLGSSPFTNSDVGMTKGVENPTEKNAYLNTNILPSALTSGGANCGMGFWERNIGFGTNVEPIGCYDTSNTERYVIDLRSTLQRFRYGAPTGSQAGPSTTASNGHYYGQRSSATLRKIYKDGTDLGANGTSSDTAGGSNTQNIFVMGCNAGTDTPWKGRCAVAYLTDGSLSDADVAALHTLLDTYVITATGR
jgi:hypothetical protein